jgi:hypothetical protein
MSDVEDLRANLKREPAGEPKIEQKKKKKKNKKERRKKNCLGSALSRYLLKQEPAPLSFYKFYFANHFRKLLRRASRSSSSGLEAPPPSEAMACCGFWV